MNADGQLLDTDEHGWKRIVPQPEQLHSHVGIHEFLFKDTPTVFDVPSRSMLCLLPDIEEEGFTTSERSVPSVFIRG